MRFKRKTKIINHILNEVLSILYPQKTKPFNILNEKESVKKANIYTKEIQFKNQKIPVTYFFNYRDKEVKNMIYTFKFYNNKESRNIFLQKTLEYIEHIETDITPFSEKLYITSIPDSFKRIQKHGYGHMDIFLKDMMKELKGKENIHIDTLLQWKNKKMNQHTLNKKKRKENVSHMLKCKKDVAQKHIVVIDDVFTTGETLLEAYRELTEKNAEKIYLITFSH